MFHLEHVSVTSVRDTKHVPPGTRLSHLGSGHETCSTWNTSQSPRLGTRNMFHLEHVSVTSFGTRNMFHLEHVSVTSVRDAKHVPPGTRLSHLGSGHETCSTWNTSQSPRFGTRNMFHLEHVSVTSVRDTKHV